MGNKRDSRIPEIKYQPTVTKKETESNVRRKHTNENRRMTIKTSPFTGRWRIVSMSAWDQEFIDEEEEG